MRGNGFALPVSPRLHSFGVFLRTVGYQRVVFSAYPEKIYVAGICAGNDGGAVYCQSDRRFRVQDAGGDGDEPCVLRAARLCAFQKGSAGQKCGYQAGAFLYTFQRRTYSYLCGYRFLGTYQQYLGVYSAEYHERVECHHY